MCTGINQRATSDLCQYTPDNSHDLAGHVHYGSFAKVDWVSPVDIYKSLRKDLARQYAIRATAKTYE